MRSGTAAIIVLLTAGVCAGQTYPATTPATAPAITPATYPSTAPATPSAPPVAVLRGSVADRLAAESLRHSATSLVHAPPDTPGRTGRLIALCLLADRLSPGNPQTHRLLAGIYEIQGRLESAAVSAKLCLDASPQDYTLGQLWLRLELAGIETKVEDQVTFLKGVANDEKLPQALRADAASLLGGLLRGRDADAATDSFRQALKLDPRQVRALAAIGEMRKDVKDIDRIHTAFALLRSNPRSWETAGELGVLMGRVGSYDNALMFFNYAEHFLRERDGGQALPHDLALAYLNAALDGGAHAGGAGKFSPMLQQFTSSLDFRTLLIEAYRGAGGAEAANQLIKATEKELKSSKPADGASADFDMKLAWFYLLTLHRPADEQADVLANALAYARAAVLRKPADPVSLRILGAAELVSGDPDLVAKGRDKLRKIADKDIYAAAFLAEHYFAAGDKEAGEKAIQDGAKLGRSGPAFRRLRALADKHKIEIPPVADIEAVEQGVKDIKPYLTMGAAPQSSLELTISSVRDSFAPGEAIEVEATLTNKGEIDVPLGSDGLLSPVLSLTVTVEGARGRFTDLPLVSLPAPRYLAPGKSVRSRVRVDVGGLASHLTARPLDTIQLLVSGTPDPIQRGTEFRSSAPSLPVKPAMIRRIGLIESFEIKGSGDWAKNYQLMLGYIVRDMKRGTIDLRCRSARQVASLLTLARGLEDKRIHMPYDQEKAITKPVLLTMMREVLRNADHPVVRAEMLTALQAVPLDADILQLLGPCIKDTSPLVRFRLVELIGASGTQGRNTILDLLAGDGDNLVRMMSSAFRQKQ